MNPISIKQMMRLKIDELFHINRRGGVWNDG